jgi:D-serine deaminase-like pyridoxal phosphate-dependent protein
MLSLILLQTAASVVATDIDTGAESDAASLPVSLSDIDTDITTTTSNELYNMPALRRIPLMAIEFITVLWTRSGSDIIIAIVLLLSVYLVLRHASNFATHKRHMNTLRAKSASELNTHGKWDRIQLQQQLNRQHIPTPCVLVDMDQLKENALRFAELARANGKTIRIATKSLRVPELIQDVVQMAPDVYKGFMCFSVTEAHFLWKKFGWDDFLVAYPTTDIMDITLAWVMTQSGVSIILMVDVPDHVHQIGVTARAQVLAEIRAKAEEDECNEAKHKEHSDPTKVPTVDMKIPLKICIDADMSLNIFGKHIGAHRSGTFCERDVHCLIDDIGRYKSVLKFVGVMGYEAQIAGVADSANSCILNAAIRFMKRISRWDVRRKRSHISKLLRLRETDIELFNGGGTGSIITAVSEPWLTEVTVGSGLLQSQYFDAYDDNKSEP